jgi:hypothetical protein
VGGELPAILHDPEIRLAPHRAFRMLAYAADTLRGAALTPGPAHRPARSWAILFSTAGLILMAWSIWGIVRAPEHWVNYAYLAWSLLLAAWPISQYVRSTARMTGLLAISSCLAGAVVYSWNTALAPGDWVNYLPPPGSSCPSWCGSSDQGAPRSGALRAHRSTAGASKRLGRAV